MDGIGVAVYHRQSGEGALAVVAVIGAGATAALGVAAESDGQTLMELVLFLF